ncbi:MAG: chorismate-binding protein [Chlamydiales bacterium]
MPKRLENDHCGSLISLENGTIFLGQGSYKRAPKLDHLDPRKPAFYLPDFFLRTASPWIQYDSWQELSIKEFQVYLEGDQVESIEPLDWHIDHEDLFQEAFAELQQAFREGRLEKGVPYAFASTSDKMSWKRLRYALKHAVSYIQSYPGYLYGHWEGQSGFLGVTPEILFRHHQEQPSLLWTMALAGTRKENDCPEEFEKNEKEHREHQLVIEGISKDLQRMGKVIPGKTSVLNLPTLKHLLTPIEVHLDQPFHFESAVVSMHPTPALGAFPRQEGWRWLESVQKKLDRQHYGAPFGFCFGSRGLSFCVVAIRQVQWSASGMRIPAGCGVIKSSILQKEWDEVQLKIRAIRNLLAL